MGCEVEGCLVVVRRYYSCATGERDDGGKADAAPQLDGACTVKVAFREVARQSEGARPQLGPVREPLIAVEVVLVDQLVS